MPTLYGKEAKAIDLALDFINECNLKDKFIIFSDSMSVLQALNHTSFKNPQIQKTINKTSYHLRIENNYLLLGSQSYRYEW